MGAHPALGARCSRTSLQCPHGDRGDQTSVSRGFAKTLSPCPDRWLFRMEANKRKSAPVLHHPFGQMPLRVGGSLGVLETSGRRERRKLYRAHAAISPSRRGVARSVSRVGPIVVIHLLAGYVIVRSAKGTQRDLGYEAGGISCWTICKSCSERRASVY